MYLFVYTYKNVMLTLFLINSAMDHPKLKAISSCLATLNP